MLWQRKQKSFTEQQTDVTFFEKKKRVVTKLVTASKRAKWLTFVLKPVRFCNPADPDENDSSGFQTQYVI